MEQADFIKRLVELRMNKGVSARDIVVGQETDFHLPVAVSITAITACLQQIQQSDVAMSLFVF